MYSVKFKDGGVSAVDADRVFVHEGGTVVTLFKGKDLVLVLVKGEYLMIHHEGVFLNNTVTIPEVHDAMSRDRLGD